MRNAGVHFVEIETADELERAINDNTVMMFFVYLYEVFSDEPGRIGLEEFAALGRKHGIPTLIDGSNTVPPMGRLSEYLDAGFDLACFSGGKGLRGPYSAGMLLGREDLIAAARLNATPNADTVGRGMKVSKEEVLGMLVAVEFSQQYDYSVENVRETRLVNLIAEKLSVLPGITTQVSYPATEGGRPHLQIFWGRVADPAIGGGGAEGAGGRGAFDQDALLGPFRSDGQLEVGTAMLKDHEVDVVVRRLGEVLAPQTV